MVKGHGVETHLRWDIYPKPGSAYYSQTDNLDVTAPLGTTGACLQHLMPLLLQISYSSHGLYLSESWYCNKYTTYQAEFNATPTGGWFWQLLVQILKYGHPVMNMDPLP